MSNPSRLTEFPWPLSAQPPTPSATPKARLDGDALELGKLKALEAPTKTGAIDLKNV